MLRVIAGEVDNLPTNLPVSALVGLVTLTFDLESGAHYCYCYVTVNSWKMHLRPLTS